MGKAYSLYVSLAYKYRMSSIKNNSLASWSLELWEVVGGVGQVEWQTVCTHSSEFQEGGAPSRLLQLPV